MTSIFLLIISLVTHSLHANWQDHLSPCPNKEGDHSIDGIDFIYMINLQSRSDKLAISLNQLRPYGITPYRFDAINGWSLPTSICSDLQPMPFSPFMNRGRIGCLLSHLSVLQDAYLSGYETIWVMEDDIDVVQNPHLMSDLIASLDLIAPDWDILYTDIETKTAPGIRTPPLSVLAHPGVVQYDPSFYKKREPITPAATLIGMRFGCYSMILRRSAIEKILHFFTENNLFLPIDNELPHVPTLKQITLAQDIVSHRSHQESNTLMSQKQHARLNQKTEKKR